MELSEADQLLYGKVLGIKSLISYEGRTVAELVSDFHAANAIVGSALKAYCR